MSHDQARQSRWGRRLSRRAALAAGVRVGAGMVGLAGAAGVVSAGERGGRVRAQKSRTVSRRFRQFTPIVIPDQGFVTPYPSVVRANGFNSSAKVKDVNVKLHTLNHPYLNDLDILLQAPSGERCVVVSDAGNTTDAGISLTFDDAASQMIGPDDEGVTGGTYRPVNHNGNTDFGRPNQPSWRGSRGSSRTATGS